MAAALRYYYLVFAFLFVSNSCIFSASADVRTVVGVNYGTVADNLPVPSEVVKLIQSTNINKIKLYNADPNILSAFANSGIQFVIGIPNEVIQSLTNLNTSRQWVKENVAAYMPATQISLLAVGNEVLATKDRVLMSQLLRAMENLHAALVFMGLASKVKVSSPHSLGILHSSVPPSSGSFRSGLTKAILRPMLSFLLKTGAPFMANAYPFFGYIGNPSPNSLSYALFTSDSAYIDPTTKLRYANMFDAQVDAVYSAMAALGYTNIDVVVSETGWPSLGDPNEVGVNLENAETFNSNLVKHLLSNKGTPLRPNKTVETYIFALFNEDLKPGPTSERNFGLFKPDMTPAYNAGVYENQNPTSSRTPEAAAKGKSWCVARPDTDPIQLQKSIDFACGQGGADCVPIQANEACYLPNSLLAHASYAMNSYYQNQGRHTWDCFFNKSGMIVNRNPSYGACSYPFV
eukprot:c5418_g1_i1 orf=326-1708(+)